MIRAMVTLKDGRPLYLLGIDAENVKRLTHGKPIKVELEPLGGTGDVVIWYGETLAELRAELQESLGVELPELPEELRNG